VCSAHFCADEANTKEHPIITETPFNYEDILPGLLTKTLVSTPYTKFILPAKIRHSGFDDVVFIGENVVHLKELRADGSLRHVLSKVDLKGKVLAAKVLATSQTKQSPFEANLADDEYVIPPEVIVLILDSCELMFLWTEKAGTGFKFRHTALRMPYGKTRRGQPISLLAVDPKSRAIAVAFSEDKFMLYKTKSADEWANDNRHGRDTVPIEEEKLIQCPGRMMHMDFLAPGAAEDDSHVILLFILAHSGRTKISCYDWDSRCPLTTATPRAERLSVDFGKHLSPYFTSRPARLTLLLYLAKILQYAAY